MTAAELSKAIARRGIRLSASGIRVAWHRNPDAPRTVEGFVRWYRAREKAKYDRVHLATNGWESMPIRPFVPTFSKEALRVLIQMGRR